MKVIQALLATLVSMPIWFYLLYQILVRVDASELMMFLFWVYVPVSIFVGMLANLIGGKK